MIEETEIGQRRRVCEALEHAVGVATVPKVLETKRTPFPFLKRQPVHLQVCSTGHIRFLAQA